MSEQPTRPLTRVLWIGGATDAGKSTVADLLAEQLGAEVYHYDRHDLRHIELLAQTHKEYREFLDATLDARWVTPEPEQLAQRALQSFQDRFPMVLEDLNLSKTCLVIAEGFGLTPELVEPVLASPFQAVWLVPTLEFKLESMRRRNKPSFRDQVSDPERATQNLIQRDVLPSQRIQVQAQARGFLLLGIDGAKGIGEMADRIEEHYRIHLKRTLTCD